MKKKFSRIDKPLLLISIVLFIIGLIMIFSASNVTAYMKYYASPYRFIFKQLIFLIISVVLGIIAIVFVKRKFYYADFTLFVYGVGALLLFVLMSGAVKNNSIRWIDFGFFSLQPSELAKIAIIFYMAIFYDKYKDKLNNPKIVLYPMIVATVLGFLIFREPDLDTTIIYFLIVLAMFFAAPIEKQLKNKLMMIGVGAIVIGVIVLLTSGRQILTPGQYNRLINFHNPCSTERYYSDGNQVCNGYIAINNGGFKGVGLGNSTQKYLYLPEAHTDFIFAIIMEELGLVGAIVIIGLYFLLVGRIIKIAKESKTTFGFMLCSGVASYIVLHIGVNLGGMFGLIPTTGVPLPFMSYGGTFCLCLVIALCFVQKVNIENNAYKEAESHGKRIKSN